MKVYYDKDGNITTVENNAFKWLMIFLSIMMASLFIGIGISGGY